MPGDDRYGTRILHGDNEYRVEGLIGLAGWHPPLTDAETALLRVTLAQAGEHDLGGFMEREPALRAGRCTRSGRSLWATVADRGDNPHRLSHPAGRLLLPLLARLGV